MTRGARSKPHANKPHNHPQKPWPPRGGLFHAQKEATVNTEELPDIPEGVEVSDSAGSETPDVEAPEPVDYSDVEVEA